MKHIRTYENITNKYNIDDYVVFFDKLEDRVLHGIISNFLEIGSIIYYTIKVVVGPDSPYYSTNIQQKFVFRKMTDEEIEQSKMEMGAKEYNL